MPFEPIVTELDVEVEEPFDGFPAELDPYYTQRVYDPDRDIWWSAAVDYSGYPDVSLTAYRGTYGGTQAVALATITPELFNGAFHLAKVGDWVILFIRQVGFLAAHVSDTEFSPMYLPTFGREPYYGPDEFTYFPDDPPFAACGSGLAYAFPYTAPNTYPDPGGSPPWPARMDVSDVAVTSDPRTDAGWTTAVTLLPRQAFTAEDQAGGGWGPGRAYISRPAENDQSVIFEGFTIPYTDYSSEFMGFHYWRILYDKSGATWTTDEFDPAVRGAVRPQRGAGSRWLGYDSMNNAAVLSDTSDPDGTYTTLTLPDFSPDYLMVSAEDWPTYTGNGQWLGVVRSNAEWTDEWDNTNYEQRWRWVALNLDWSEWAYVDDALPSRYIGNGPLDPRRPYLNSEGGVVIPLTTYAWKRYPDYEYWDYGDQTYWVLSFGEGTSGGGAGWD